MSELLQTVEWEAGRVRLIDQNALPAELKYVELEDWRQCAEAISTMVVRGAPAIGCTAALAMAMAARMLIATDRTLFLQRLETVASALKAARPTAVNLAWAVDRLMRLATETQGTTADLKEVIQETAVAMLQEDVEINRRMGRFGADLLPEQGGVLTHCNAGALATVGYGTALGVIRAAKEQGKQIEVFADETRPRLQGMKLTAWELIREGIKVTLIADNMAAALLQQGKVQCVVVGADRIAANGDTANKIGTCALAIVASHYHVPFYVAAPVSTFDMNLPNGSGIPIEERNPEEITHIAGERIAPVGVQVWNPAFDVTPACLISGFITEQGVLKPPWPDSLASLQTRNSAAT